MSELLKWLIDNPSAGVFVAMGAGVLITAASVIYTTAFFQGREISFWPPKIGSKPSTSPAFPVRGKSHHSVSDGDASQTDNLHDVQKLLFLAANPIDTQPLRLSEEIRAIREALHRSPLSNQLSVEQGWSVRAEDIITYLHRYEPSILHFSGHGSSDGLVLEDSSGRSVIMAADRFLNIIQAFRGQIKLMVINSQFSSSMIDALAKHVDFVVGISDMVAEEEAIQFAATFYEALGNGSDLQKAFNLGRIQVESDKGGYRLASLRSNANTYYITKREVGK